MTSYRSSYISAPAVNAGKRQGSSHKAAGLSSAHSVLPNKLERLSIHSGSTANSDSKSSSLHRTSTLSGRVADEQNASQGRRPPSPSLKRHSESSTRHVVFSDAGLPRYKSNDESLHQKSSPVVPHHSRSPPPYERPSSITGYSSNRYADFGTKRCGSSEYATERRPPSSPVRQRRSDLKLGDSPARQKRREEKSSSSPFAPGSPNLLNRPKSGSMYLELPSQNQRSSRRGDSVADCLNFQPVSDSFHEQQDQHHHTYSSGKLTNKSEKVSTAMDYKVERNALHLDPINSPEKLKSPERTTFNSSPKSYNSLTSRSRNSELDYKTVDSSRNSDSRLPPIVSPTAKPPQLPESLMRVRKLLSSYIRKKDLFVIADKQKYLDMLESSYVQGCGAGLPNVGNTCYMNSILQCLSHTLEMTHFFLTHTFKTGLSSEYKDLLEKIWLKETPSYSVSSGHKWSSSVHAINYEAMRSFKRRFSSTSTQFMGFAQHDAQEFLLHFISKIHSEVNKPPPPVPEICKSSHEIGGKVWRRFSESEESTPISDFFMGEFESCLQCNTCKKKTILHDQYWDIGLPVFEVPPGRSSVSLYKCLSIFEEDERMQGTNKPFCEKCKKLCDSTLRMTIHRLPPILCIYLKRFDWSNPRFPKKLSTAVEIPYNLDLTSCCRSGQVATKKMLYGLYGVTNHTGTLFAGHYTAYVKHYATEVWFDCNDSRVGKSHQMPTSKRTFTSKDAYVLFYRRIEATSPPNSA